MVMSSYKGLCQSTAVTYDNSSLAYKQLLETCRCALDQLKVILKAVSEKKCKGGGHRLESYLNMWESGVDIIKFGGRGSDVY